ncbi:MAG: bifunctional diguanylate cyclase/phosphodiesterase [Hyphomicrobiales bacterium]
MGTLSEREVLTSLGEVVYEWSIGDDQLRWGPNALDVLHVGSFDAINTGRRFAALLDPSNSQSRYDVVVTSAERDRGGGVPYELQYRLLPKAGADKGLWIEDSGRWFVGPDGKPGKAHGTLRIINERHEREERLAYLSSYDELTGQLNRVRFVETLGEVIEDVKRFQISAAFIIVAVDNLRIVNEAYGYDVADQVIALVAKRLATRLRGGDSLGRYSGNKLGVLLRNCDEREVEVAAKRLQAAVREEVITTEWGPVAASVTMGGVVLPRYARDLHEVQSRASEALDLAKLKNRGGFVAYRHSRERDEKRRENIQLADEVVRGLNEKRFSLAYQPVVDARTGAVDSYECLLRLRRADGSVVSAGNIIPIMEKLGLVRLIDNRVLDLALADLISHPELRLAINVSGATAGDMDWLGRLTAAMRLHPDLKGRIIIEITETMALHDIDEACRFVSMLKELGCAVAIDDFGAGYTSFRNLKQLDIDHVKIDGSFIENVANSAEDQVFVRTLIELARTFNLKTVAECVEDPAAAELLNSWGIDLFQGHLYGAASLEKPWDRNNDGSRLTA